MSTSDRVIIVISAIVGVWMWSALVGPGSKLEKLVKDGSLTLTCYIDNIDKEIEPEKIKYLVEDTWVFTNGSAKNCKVE